MVRGGKEPRWTRLLPAAGLSLLLAGCAMLGGREAAAGGELVGRTMRIQTVRGDVTTLRFRQDGNVRASFRGRSVTGRWRLADRRLCFFWSGAPRECWPYRRPFERGRTRTVTSDRGNIVRVTLL